VGISQIIDPFYKLLPDATYRKAPTVGQLCWIPVPRLEEIPFVLDVERAQPTEHYATKFAVRQMCGDDFKSKNRLPIKLLSLGNTEELIAQRAKRRLAVVVSADYTIFDDLQTLLRQRAQKHLQQQFITVAPLYGCEGATHEGGFPPVLVARIKALLYGQFFYCPPKATPSVYEAVVRLDRLQPVVPRHPTYEPTQVALSDDALILLRTMLRRLFWGVPKDPDDAEKNLAVVREIALEALLPEHLPKRASAGTR
jgi:hypothetical protein